MFISEKSKPKLWNVSWINTLNHSSFLNKTISEFFWHDVVYAVFTWSVLSVINWLFGNIFLNVVKYKYKSKILLHLLLEYKYWNVKGKINFSYIHLPCISYMERERITYVSRLNLTPCALIKA